MLQKGMISDLFLALLKRQVHCPLVDTVPEAGSILFLTLLQSKFTACCYQCYRVRFTALYLTMLHSQDQCNFPGTVKKQGHCPLVKTVEEAGGAGSVPSTVAEAGSVPCSPPKNYVEFSDEMRRSIIIIQNRGL
jgi:hypothetical protein